MSRLNGKVAVVTGGGSGIGEAIARRFGQEGASVAILDLNTENADKVAAEIESAGGKAKAFACNVADSANVKEVFKAVEKEFGGVTTLVNNAGIAHIGKVHETEPEDLDKIYNVKLSDMFLALQKGAL